MSKNKQSEQHRRRKKGKPKQPDLDLGPLPVDVINVTLSMELEPGRVIFSSAAQKHASNKHDEYPQCVPHIGAVVANPLYIGDDHRNPGKIELISRIPALQGGLLVAISVEKDADGNYNVCSMYSMPDDRIQSRKEKGFLKTAKEKGPG